MPTLFGWWHLSGTLDSREPPVRSSHYLISLTSLSTISSLPTRISSTMASNVKDAKPFHEDPKEAAEKCNKWVESGLTKNSAIQFLVQTLVDSGCTPPDSFIRCTACDQPAAGGFGMVQEQILPSKKGIVTALKKQESASLSSKEQCNRTKNDLQSLLDREKTGQSALVIKPEIFLCQQYMESEIMTHKTMVHEFIHAIDMCRTKMDPLHNCVR